MLQTYILFIIFLFIVSKQKGDLSDKIFFESQLATKTNQLTYTYQFVQSEFSSVLDYTRFKQPLDDNKKLQFSVTLLN